MNKKGFIVLILSIFLLSISSFALADNDPPNYTQTKYATKSTGWPMDHYIASVLGNPTSVTWIWEVLHGHATNIQQATCGDTWKVHNYLLTDGTTTYTNTSHAAHNHTGINSSHYENFDKQFLLIQGSSLAVFNITHDMKHCQTGRNEHQEGSKWLEF